MNQQQEQTQTQRHLAILNAIDELSTITAETDDEKKKITTLYKSYKNIVLRFIQEKSQIDDSAKTLYDRLSSSGVESLSEQDFDSLRRLMFSALVTQEGKLFQTKEKAEASRPNLMFGETLNAINKERDRAKREKQEKNREFIEQLVLRFGSSLELSPKEQEFLKQTLLKQEETLRKTYGDRVIPEQQYIQEAKQAIQKLKPQALSRHPTEQANVYFENLYNKSPDIQSIYQQAKLLHRKELTYQLLEKEVVLRQKNLAIRNDLQEVYPPFVALEAATYVLLETSPSSLLPEEIIQQATQLENAFVGYQLEELPQRTEDLAFLIQESIGSRYGNIAQKQSIELLDQVLNQSNRITEESKESMLYEFIRADIQRDLFRIIQDKQLLQQILTNNGAGPMTNEAFQLFLQSPLFAFIEKTIKEQSNQEHGGFIGRLFQIISSAKEFGYPAPETNTALSFIFTAGDLAKIQENKELYERFVKAFPGISKENDDLPKTPAEAFFSLVLATVHDPNRELFFELTKTIFEDDEHKEHYHLYFLDRIIDHYKEKAINRFKTLIKPYVVNVLRFGKKSISSLLRNKVFSSVSSRLARLGVKKIGGFVFKKFGLALVGGPVGTAIAVLSTAIDILKMSLSYFFQDIPFLKDMIKDISWEKIIIYPIVFVLIGIYFFFFSVSNPISTEQKLITSFIDFEETLQEESFPPSNIISGCYEDASQIVAEAERILTGLQQGIWRFWNYHPEYPQYGKYSKTAAEGGLIEGQDPTNWYEKNIYKNGLGNPKGEDLFWCTWLVSIAYRRAGAPAPFTAGVRKAFSDWVGQKVNANTVNVFDVPLGSAIFFDRETRRNAHIGLLCEKQTQNGRDGTITTCESNSSQKKHTYNVVNGIIQESRLANRESLRISTYGLPPESDPNSPACQNRDSQMNEN